MENRPLTEQDFEKGFLWSNWKPVCSIEKVQSAKRTYKDMLNAEIVKVSEEYVKEYKLGNVAMSCLLSGNQTGLITAKRLIDACFQIPDGDDKR
jgi:hypothetical protein